MVIGSGDAELATQLLSPKTPSNNPKIQKDSFQLAYIIYFTLGTGYLLPWNAFITAVDYFRYLYPDASVDRTFEVAFTTVDLTVIILIIVFKKKSSSFLRINVGSVLFLVALLVVPLMDVWYVKGRVGVYGGYYVTVCLVGLCGIADALVQGGILGSAGELPEKYMQALIAGTAVSGVLVSLLRIFTKALYPQDAMGLRKSAYLYFIVSIAMMVLCIILYNVVHLLPVSKYYNQLKIEAVVNDERQEKDDTGSNKLFWRSTLWDVLGTMKWYGFGVVVAYGVSWSLFPGSITEDFHSSILKDWYPILLITGFNVFDLLGKCLTSIYLLKDPKLSIGGSFVRLLFLPVFYCCLHGPKFLRSEFPVSILTCLLAFTNGYFTSVLFILAPKTVQLQHAETAGIVLALLAVVGTTIASPLSYLLLV